MVLPTFAQARQPEPDSLESEVSKTADEYERAEAEYEKVAKRVSENEAKIKALQEKLPERREAAANAIKSSYKLQQGSPTLLTLIFSSDDFQSFISMVTYISSIQDKNVSALDELVKDETELKEREETLETQRKEAAHTRDQAKSALDKAVQARQDAQRRAEEQARKEADEARKAIEAAKKAAENNESFQANQDGPDVSITVPSGDLSSVNWSVPRDQFIKNWSKRINSYLSGTPMSGTGEYFARAAWTYGVDPRWSPAIARIESGCGAAIPNRNGHNAWGWTSSKGGFRQFSSWKEGIYAHVAYLGSMYGPTITPSAAKIYCPPNWANWYAMVSSQMNAI